MFVWIKHMIMFWYLLGKAVLLLPLQGFCLATGLFSKILEIEKIQEFITVVACSKFQLKNSCNLGFSLFLGFLPTLIRQQKQCGMARAPNCTCTTSTEATVWQIVPRIWLSWKLLLWAIWKIFANNQFLHRSQYWFLDSKISCICHSQTFQPKLFFFFATKKISVSVDTVLH